MANKDQRGNRETRKPKQEKAKPAVAASSFSLKIGNAASGPSGKK